MLQSLNIILVYIRLKWMKPNHSIRGEALIGRWGPMLTCTPAATKQNKDTPKIGNHSNPSTIWIVVNCIRAVRTAGLATPPFKTYWTGTHPPISPGPSTGLRSTSTNCILSEAGSPTTESAHLPNLTKPIPKSRRLRSATIASPDMKQ